MLENNYFKMRKEFEEIFEGPEYFKGKFVLGILDFIFKHGNDDLKLEPIAPSIVASAPSPTASTTS